VHFHGGLATRAEFGVLKQVLGGPGDEGGLHEGKYANGSHRIPRKNFPTSAPSGLAASKER
jgi:hypothetical protein